MSTEKYKKSLALRNLRENIRKIKKSRKATFRTMAKEVGITDQYLSDILNGRADPNQRLIDDMSRAWKVRRDVLLGEESPLID